MQSTPDPRDIASATELVDYTLRNASETYRQLHRDRLIRNEVPFQRFMRETREAKARRVAIVKRARAA